MMPPEVKLTYYDAETGQKQRIKVDSPRFTIGRLPENDLPIEDSNLSRRHAIIESFEGSVLISDCGSQNGTQVNGVQIAGAVVLNDGDVISLGGAREITIAIRQDLPHDINRGSHGSSTSAYPPPTPVQTANQSNLFSLAPSWLNAPVIAGAAAVLILLGAGLLLALTSGPGSTPSKTPSPPLSRNQGLPKASERRTQPSEPTEPATPPVDDNPGPKDADIKLPADSDELKIVEKNARIVMSSISNDSSPFLPSDAVSQISEQVKRYRGSAVLRDRLRVIKQRGIQELVAPARENNIKPALAIFAGLAKMDRDDERTDPLAAAQGMLPKLKRLAIIFGTETANDTLLTVATVDQPPDGNFHPLQMAISRLAKDQHESVNKIRSVWYLNDHQKITPRGYNLVLRLLAIGVIAQDPRHFGIDAEPLSF